MVPARREAGNAHSQSPDERSSAPQRERIARFVAEAFSSPHPPPEVLRAYNEVLPGLAERMVSMTEEYSRHKMAEEREITAAKIANAVRDFDEGRRGQYCAVAVVAMAVVGAVVLGLNHAVVASTFLGVSGLGTVVAHFIYGRKNGRKPEEPPKAADFPKSDEPPNHDRTPSK